MNQTNLDDTLDVLNDLLQTSKDGEAGFRPAPKTCAIRS